MEVTVLVGTFGTDDWRQLAVERAIPSVPDGVPVIHEHADSLHEARNAALAKADTEFVCHLDADDELTPDFFRHMEMFGQGADIRAPAVSYVRNGHRRPAGMPRVWDHHHDCEGACLRDGNWIVVGAVARTQVLRDVGGWQPFTWSEDWALWASAWKTGASIVPVPSAVYVAHVRPDSRNRAPAKAAKLAEHERIARHVWPEDYEEAA